MGVNQTFAVDARVWDSQITHSKYAALRIKDALCDYFRDKTSKRPNVSVEHADLPLFLYLYKDKAVLYRDLSGNTLHKRGYRDAMHKASLNEAVAAGIILRSGWDAQSPLADPMCGSGTFLLEAALIALQRAPGLSRKQFPFEKWPDFDKSAWKDAKGRAHTAALYALPEGVKLFGNDRHAGALSLAKKDAETSGLAEFIEFSAGDAETYKPDAKISRVISNPPWGERIDDEEVKVPWIKMSACLKALEKTENAEAWLLSGNPEGPKNMGMNKESIPLRLGNIDARMVRVRL
jgi:putative N6-adenine-specific DNA methylase